MFIFPVMDSFVENSQVQVTDYLVLLPTLTQYVLEFVTKMYMNTFILIIRLYILWLIFLFSDSLKSGEKL